MVDTEKLKALAIELSRDPAEGLSAGSRALMACIVIPFEIQEWMNEVGATEPLLDSIEKTILAAERAALPHLQAQWQDISTAPKDGRFILAWSSDGNGNPFIAQWRDADDMPDGGAWWEDHDSGFPVDADASHWMPLPAAPLIAEQREVK